MANRKIQFLRCLILLLAMFFLTSYSSKEETGSKEETSKPKELIAPGKVVTLEDCSDFETIYWRLGFAKDRLKRPPGRNEFESEEEYQKRLEKDKEDVNQEVRPIYNQLYKVTFSHSNLIMRTPFTGTTLKEPLKFRLLEYNLNEGSFPLSHIKWAPETTLKEREMGLVYDFTVYSYLEWEEDTTIKIEKSVARRVRNMEDKLYLDLIFKVVDVDITRSKYPLTLAKYFLRTISIQPIKMTLRGEGKTFWQWGEEAAGAPGVMKDPRTVEGLIIALKDKDWFVRRKAAEALKEKKDPRVVEPLIAALKDKYWMVQKEAVEALGEIKDPRAVEPLIIALKDENKDVRESAAWALGKIGAKRAVPALIEALKDEDERVRGRSADALGEIGDKRAVPALTKALQDENEDVRRNAETALFFIKSKQKKK